MREPPVITTTTTNEPSTIYFTTDGSTPTTASESRVNSAVLVVTDGMVLRFFAEDAVGNTSPVLTETWTLDVTPPAAVTDLSAVLDDPDVDVTWTNPTDPDLAGVLVVRKYGGPAFFGPVPGDFYSQGQNLGVGETIASAAVAESHSESAPTSGFVYYTLIPFDAVGNYGPPRTVFVQGPIVDLPTQNVTLEVDQQGNVNVVQAPPDFDVAATASYDGATQDLDVDLTLTNVFGRLIYNPKVVIDAISDGTFDDSNGSSIIHNGKETLLYGANAFDVGEERTRPLGLLGVTDLVVTITFRVVESAGYAVGAPTGAAIFDSSGSGMNASIGFDADTVSHGPRGGQFYTQGVISPDGRTLYLGHRQVDRVTAVDLTTLQPTLGTFLGADPNGDTRSSTPTMDLSPDGQYLYVGFSQNAHRWNRGSVASWLVKLRTSDLSEVGRVQVNPGGVPSTPVWDVEIGPGGGAAVVAFRDQPYITFVATNTMQVWDGDTGTPEPDALDVSAMSGYCKPVTFSESGDHVYCGRKWNGSELLKIASWGFAMELTAPHPSGNGRYRQLVGLPDGSIAAANRWGSGVAVYDPGTNSWTQHDDGGQVHGIAYDPGSNEVFLLMTDQRARVYDAALTTFRREIPAPAVQQWGGSYVFARTPF
jgi:hypothetical protein